MQGNQAARQQKRLIKEFNDFTKAPIAGVEIEKKNDSLLQWNVAIMGPEGSFYEGGRFIIEIDFSDNYPFKCPKMRFVTQIWHPNVKTDTGEICAQAIQNAWVPTLNSQFLINTMVELIKNPNNDSPMEAEIARTMNENPDQFKSDVQAFIEKHAK